MHDNYPTAQISGMAIGAEANRFIEVDDQNRLLQLLRDADSNGDKFRVIGGGNNTIFGGQRFAGVVIKYTASEIRLEGSKLWAQAGANWDSIVARSVDSGLSGIEALSLVPGNLAGAIVQNIGAYGQQLADACQSVEVYDVARDEIRTLTSAECDFAYRHSIFKSPSDQPLVILSAALDLSAQPTYKPESAYGQIRSILGPNPHDYSPNSVRECVLQIRRGKFPDQSRQPNCGSFFKNPVVDQQIFDQLINKFGGRLKPGETLGDATDDGKLKLRLAFLFDRILGLKGYESHGFKLSESNPLIVVNSDIGASGDRTADLQQFTLKLQNKVDAALGIGTISLVPEPDIIV